MTTTFSCGAFSGWTVAPAPLLAAPETVHLDDSLTRDLRQPVEAVDRGSDTKFPRLAALLHPNHRRAAARPFPLSACQFGRQDQHQLQLTPLGQVSIGVEEDSVGAEIARVPAELGAL